MSVRISHGVCGPSQWFSAIRKEKYFTFAERPMGLDVLGRKWITNRSTLLFNKILRLFFFFNSMNWSFCVSDGVVEFTSNLSWQYNYKSKSARQQLVDHCLSSLHFLFNQVETARPGLPQWRHFIPETAVFFVWINVEPCSHSRKISAGSEL